MSISEEELLKEYEKWEESVAKALESDKELKNIVHNEVKKVLEPIARYVEEPSLEEFTERLSRVVDKVMSYVRERYGIELLRCDTEINATPKWAGYFENEIKKNKPLSSVRLLVNCYISPPKKYEELEGIMPPELKIDVPLFFVFEKYRGEWHVSWARSPDEPDDVRVHVS